MTTRRPRNVLRDLAGDRSGASAIMVGVTMIGVMGAVGLGTDLGTWYGARREAQNAADSAAVSAAAASAAGAGDVSAQATAIAAGYGLKNGVDGVKVTVNTLSGSPQRIEVIIERPVKRFLSGLVLKTAGTQIRARAVASTGGSGDGCVLALNPSDQKAVHINGGPDVKLNGCSLYVNSTDSSGLSLNGSAKITAQSVELGGSAYFKNGSASISATDGVHYSQAPAADPYAAVDIPAYAGCSTWPTMNGSGSYVIEPKPDGSPKVFCGGDYIVNGGVTLTFKPGVYIFDRGRLIFNGNTTIRGDGVTLVLTSSTGGNYANLTINGGADVEMSAPRTGPFAGILFYKDRRAPDSGEIIFNGGADQIFRGALYFPSQFVRFNGGTSIASGGCTQLIADSVEFNGATRFAIDCSNAGTRPIGGGATALVE